MDIVYHGVKVCYEIQSGPRELLGFGCLGLTPRGAITIILSARENLCIGIVRPFMEDG